MLSKIYIARFNKEKHNTIKIDIVEGKVSKVEIERSKILCISSMKISIKQNLLFTIN